MPSPGPGVRAAARGGDEAVRRPSGRGGGASGSRSGQSRQAALKTALPVGGDRPVTPFGQVTVPGWSAVGSSTANSSRVNPPFDRRAQRPRFDDRDAPGLRAARPKRRRCRRRSRQHLAPPICPHPSCPRGLPPRSGGVGRCVGSGRSRPRRRCCPGPSAGVSAVSVMMPGVGLDHDVGGVAVLAARAGLVRMPGVGIHGGDHPVRRYLPGDLPPPVGAIRALDRLDVLPGHQRQQRHRVRATRVQLLLGLMPEHDGAHHRPARPPARRGRLVSSQAIRGLPGQGVVVGPAVRARSPPASPGTDLGHPADRGDRLSHRVLGGDRVVEDRGIQARRPLPSSTPVCLDHHPDRVEDPVRACRAPQPAPPSPSTWSDRTRSRSPPTRTRPSTADGRSRSLKTA